MKKLANVQIQNEVCNLIRVIHCLLMQPFCCGPGMFCNCFPWSSCDPFQTEMKKWLKDINDNLLNNKGMYAKAICFAETGQGYGYWKDGSMAIIAIATTEETVSLLKSENTLQQGNSGDPNWGCWCCPAHKTRYL